MYGTHGWETFVENSAVVLYYPPKAKNELAKKISEEIGVRDMKIIKKSDHGVVAKVVVLVPEIMK